MLKLNNKIDRPKNELLFEMWNHETSTLNSGSGFEKCGRTNAYSYIFGWDRTEVINQSAVCVCVCVERWNRATFVLHKNHCYDSVWIVMWIVHSKQHYDAITIKSNRPTDSAYIHRHICWVNSPLLRCEMANLYDISICICIYMCRCTFAIMV